MYAGSPRMSGTSAEEEVEQRGWVDGVFKGIPC